jgi:hypothetical protein
LPPWQLHGPKRGKPTQRSSRSRAYSGMQKFAAVPALFRSEVAQRRIQRDVGMGASSQFGLLVPGWARGNGEAADDAAGSSIRNS